MVKRLLLTLLISCLLGSTASAGDVDFVIELKNALELKKLQKKFKFEVLDQADGQPVFLIRGDKKIEKKLRKEKKKVAGVEPNYGASVPEAVDQHLDQSLIWLFSDRPTTTFFGTEVIEEYAHQEALTLIGAPDAWPTANGAGIRIAFIDTGVDPDHLALRPWLEDGVDLLGTGAVAESGGMDQSLIWLFHRLTRILRNPDLDQSLIWLFFEEMHKEGLDQSLIWLFGDQLKHFDVDQSLIWLFGNWLKQIQADEGTVDQSLIWLFGNWLKQSEEKTGTVDQSLIWLFNDLMRKFGDTEGAGYTASADQSLIWLFGDDGTGSNFGHGTVVAGLLHAVAPEATLVPIRAFDASGNSSLFLTTAAVYAAVEQGVDVINMSFSIGVDSKVFRKALNYARSHGVVLIASAGNNGTDMNAVYPAAYPNVIAVGATDLEDRLADFSNFGKRMDLLAPGVALVSTYPGGLYAKASGTSFSAPMVAGAVAVLMSQGDRGTRATRTLKRSADEIAESNPDYEKLLGDGRIDLGDAVRK